MKLRVVLADDHPFVLLGIRATFHADESMEVVGEAVSALLALLETTPCDILVTDFAMREGGSQAEDGLRLIRRVRRDWPHIRIVVLTSMSNVAILRSILTAGAMSLLNKVESMDEVAAAVRFAGVGRRYLSTSIVAALAVAGAETDALAEGPRLSPREIEVVRMFASGLSITEIARSLDRDVRTISRQKRDAMSKCGDRHGIGARGLSRSFGPGASRRCERHEPGGSDSPEADTPRARCHCAIRESGNVTEIAKELGRSVKTISAQKCAAMRKLDLSMDAELYRFAFDSGLVKTRPSRI